MLDASTSNATFNQVGNTRSVSLPDLMDVIWRRKWNLAGWIFISLGLGAIYLVVAQPTYKVASRVLVQPEGSPLGNGTSPRPEKEFLATQAEIISSPAVIQRAVASMKQPLTIDPDAEPMMAVLQSLTVKPLTGTNVLSLAYQCQNSAEGISMVEAILDSYQQFLQEMNADSRLEALRLLTRSEERLRSELENREKSYRDLRKQSPLIGQGKDAAIFQTTLLEKLGQALTEVRNRRIDFQNRMEFLAKSSAAGSVAHRPQQELPVAVLSVPANEQRAEPASSSPHAELLVSLGSNSSNENVGLDLIADVKLTGTPDSSLIFRELYLAEVRQKELEQHCGPDHPAMRAVREEVAAWKDRLRRLRDQAPIALQREIAAAQSHENRLVELYNTELENAKTNDDFLVIEKQELDGIERLKTTHNSLVVQLNDLRLLQPEDGAWGTNMTILAAPTIGTGPIWPKTSVLLILCGMIGLLGGFGTIVVLERDTWANAHSTDV